MKKVYIAFLSFAFALTSCEFDAGFEDMNVNPNAANNVAVANKFAKTVLDTSGGRYENWRNSLIYNSVLIQHYSQLLLVIGLEINISDMTVMLLHYGIEIIQLL